jgi:hypothetical protein
VIRRRFDLDREDSAAVDFFAQQWVMILEEEVEEFLLVSPLNLVMVLHGVWLICRILGRTALGEHRQSE